MGDEAKLWWEAHAREFQDRAQHPIAVVYGTYALEDDLQLIGPVDGKQLLEIGCGGAQCGIAFAKQGAIVTGIDIAAAQIEIARDLAAEHGVSITLYERDMTNLAPIESDTRDIVFTASALDYVDDIDTCFSEVRRVLKPGGVFVFSIGHPCATADPTTLLPTRSYFDTGKVVSVSDVSDEPGFAFATNYRTVSDYVNAVINAGLVIERMVEPDNRPRDPDDHALHAEWGESRRLLELFPKTLILKSRKPSSA